MLRISLALMSFEFCVLSETLNPLPVPLISLTVVRSSREKRKADRYSYFFNVQNTDQLNSGLALNTVN